MLLWAVVIEDLPRARLDRVLLLAAERPEDAKAIAREFYQAEGKSLTDFQFSAQAITEVSGPESRLFEIILRPLQGPRS